MTGIITLIGAPTDVGAGARGASMGPEALRVAQLQAVLEAQGLEVIDRGNLAGPGFTRTFPGAAFSWRMGSMSSSTQNERPCVAATRSEPLSLRS